MELRDIEIFLTLAEELHFGRTAHRLRLTTARVSQSIKKQERLIGAPLFDRTTRAVGSPPSASGSTTSSAPATGRSPRPSRTPSPRAAR